MASSTLDEGTVAFLKAHAPNDAFTETDPVKASHLLFPETTYTDGEKAEISQWVITASHVGSGSEDAAKSAERLSTLNTHLSSRTTLLGAKASVADIALYQKIAPVVSKWSAEERTGEHGYHHVVRHTDFVQNSPLFGLKLDEKVNVELDNVVFKIKPIDAKAEKERKKKEKEAAAAGAVASGATATTLTGEQGGEGKKSKKEKAKDKAQAVGDAVKSTVTGNPSGGAPEGAPTEKKKKEKKEKKPQPAPVEKPLSPSLIDLRVGHILKAVQHPDAEKLYVSTIACGDAPGTENTSEHEGQVVRTVCSGLNGKIPLEELQGRKIIAVCNLKPVKMRGIQSCAMVLCASPRPAAGEDDHAMAVEFVNPPADAKAGDRVYFDGWEGEPDAVLKAPKGKKNAWEIFQPGFTTTDDLEAALDAGDIPELSPEGADKKTGVAKLRTSAGNCTVSSFKGAALR